MKKNKATITFKEFNELPKGSHHRFNTHDIKIITENEDSNILKLFRSIGILGFKPTLFICLN